jgi:hypothetical protein
MKFKVRIISKAARYGIKIYVVTDACTSFVLGIIVYTGKFTYTESTSESTKNPFKWFNSFVSPFVAAFGPSTLTAFTVPSTCWSSMGVCNRIPKQMTIGKSSKEFRALKRGDAIAHKLNYRTISGDRKRAGLGAWKDRIMVYCLTKKDTLTAPMDECRRRGQGGINTIKWP